MARHRYSWLEPRHGEFSNYPPSVFSTFRRHENNVIIHQVILKLSEIPIFFLKKFACSADPARH
jgi:hypothetical protein